MPEPSSIRVVLHPKARAELNGAARYYRQTAGRDLADRFLAEFWRCANWLRKYPEAATSVGDEGVRRKLLQDDFPYSLYYVLLPGRIRIVQIANQSQDQKDLSDRLHQ